MSLIEPYEDKECPNPGCGAPFTGGASECDTCAHVRTLGRDEYRAETVDFLRRIVPKRINEFWGEAPKRKSDRLARAQDHRLARDILDFFDSEEGRRPGKVER